MDDDPSDTKCTKDGCVNVRNNLKLMLATTKRQASDLQSLSRIQAETEILKMKLIASEEQAQVAVERAFNAVNAKETAEADLKQLQVDVEFHRRRVVMLQEQADEAEKHKQQANHWRDKYDTMCSLAEVLDGKNLDVKAKYEGAVHTLSVVGKQLLATESQMVTLKTTNTDLSAKQKKLDKYLKSSIQVIDALSQTANLSKQPKAIKDLVQIFRRDDVRLYFNTTPWKNSSGRNAKLSDSEGENSDSPIQGGATLSDDNHDDDDDDVANTKNPEEDDFEEDVVQLEQMLTDQVRESVKTRKSLLTRPDFGPKMKELKAKSQAPRMVPVKNLAKWPAGLKKPAARTGHGIIDPQKVHSRVAPTCDFDTISQVADNRKKALLGVVASTSTASASDAPEVSAAPTTMTTSIHGRKGKTVREQQAEMMKESVKEKVARLKAQKENQKTTEDVPSTSAAPPPTTPKTQKPRYKSLCMSEHTDSENEVELECEDGAERRSRSRRSSSVMTRSRSISRSSEGTRRSERVAAAQKEPVFVTPVVRRRTTSTRSSKPASPVKPTPTTPAKTPPSPAPSQSASRAERARARSVSRVNSEKLVEQDEPKKPELTTREVLKKRLAEQRARQKAAPAPIDAGPPTRTKSVMGVTAPRKKVGPSVIRSEDVEEAPEAVKNQETVTSSESVMEIPEPSILEAPEAVTSLESVTESEDVETEIVETEIPEPSIQEAPEAVTSQETVTSSESVTENVTESEDVGTEIPEPSILEIQEEDNIGDISTSSEESEAPLTVDDVEPISSEQSQQSSEQRQLDLKIAEKEPLIVDTEPISSSSEQRQFNHEDVSDAVSSSSTAEPNPKDLKIAEKEPELSQIAPTQIDQIPEISDPVEQGQLNAPEAPEAASALKPSLEVLKIAEKVIIPPQPPQPTKLAAPEAAESSKLLKSQASKPEKVTRISHLQPPKLTAPKQKELVSQLGLDISDSEEEEEESAPNPAPVPPGVSEKAESVAPERIFKRRGERAPAPAKIPAPLVKKPPVLPSATTSNSAETDDLLGDVLSGAKMKKPAKRPLTSSSGTSAPAPKKPTIPIIDVPAPKKRATKAPKEAEPGEPRVPRRRPKSTQPEKPKEPAQKKSAKLSNSLKAQLRQALDLKVAVNELKRPMEEKGITLGDSIPLTASDAADVMIDFLRETSAGDMWAVMMKQRADGNAQPLMNTEEQNFLQVSVSLNDHDQELLELFCG
uniref:Uncharacterized protein n=2 Tax=Caenorhabditis japonica TaxID=281687 RepID=A0A8R1DU28_CAEJA